MKPVVKAPTVLTIYFCIILLMVISSCIESNKDYQGLEIDINSQENILFSHFVDSITYVELDPSTSESIIGVADDIVLYNDRFYIKDRISQSIIVYDKTGRFNTKINHIGKGPGEYTSISDFNISSHDSTLHILDTSLRKLFKYTLDGQFLSEIRLTDIVRTFAIFSNGKYLFCTPDDNYHNRRGIWIANHDGVFENHLIEISDNFNFFATLPWIFNQNIPGRIGFLGIEDDNIYHLENDRMSIYNTLLYDNNISRRLSSRKLEELRDITFFLKCLFFETNNWIIIAIAKVDANTRDGSTILYIFSKRDNSGVSGNMMINDYDSLQGTPTRAGDENSIIFIIPAEEYYKTTYDINNHNPVLQILHLK